MYRSIVVPLDGSTFAEHALPAAVGIAEAHQARVTLIRAWNPADYHYAGEFAPHLPEVGARERLAATQYLDSVASRLRPGTPVTIDVALLTGSSAEAIEDHVRRDATDLVVMTTHGATGWHRAWIGSVADSVLRMVTIPVLLCRPLEVLTEMPAGKFACVLLPLDGSTETEQILTHAREIGGDARFVLLRVVRPVVTPVHPYPYAARATETDNPATEAEVARSFDYLNAIATELTARHPAATVDVDVRVADRVGAAIVEAARDYHADLVGLTTHARKAIRLVLGSVADKVLRGTHGSVLVLRPTPVRTPQGESSSDRADDKSVNADALTAFDDQAAPPRSRTRASTATAPSANASSGFRSSSSISSNSTAS